MLEDYPRVGFTILSSPDEEKVVLGTVIKERDAKLVRRLENTYGLGGGRFF